MLNEPVILKKLKNSSNFVPEIISAFQDYENIYLVTTIYDGPSLSVFKNENLSEKQIKFIAACIIQSFKDIRKKEIIHRDLILSNVMMDKDNYFNLIDFSFSVTYNDRYSKTLKCNFDILNTPPEILNNTEYDYNSDYFRLGYLLFFLVFKKNPWEVAQGKNLPELIDIYNLRGKFSTELFDFLNSLIAINIIERIGYKSIEELMNHRWFLGFDWKKLEKKKIISPFLFDKNKIDRPVCKRFIKNLKKNIQNIDLWKIFFIKKLYLNLINQFLIFYNKLFTNLCCIIASFIRIRTG